MKKNSGKAQGKAAQGKISTRKKSCVINMDIDKMVKDVKPLVRQYKKITVKLLRELYLSREQFNKQNKKNNSASWSEFCHEIGMGQKTVDGWLRCYDPFELSKAGKKKEAKS